MPRLIYITLFSACLALITDGTVRANGGTFATSVVEGTGHLVPERKSRIALEREVLRVGLDRDMATVDVEYSLRNRGGADTVTYGFPVDALSPLNERDLAHYSISDGKQQIDVRKVLHEPAGGEMLTEGVYGKRVRDWFVSDVSFVRGERKALKVNYRVRTFGTMSGTSKSFRWTRSANRFRYNFRTAQTWGNGRLPELRVEVDVRRLRASSIPVSVAPAGAVERDGVLVWNFTDVDLRKAPDLVISYDLGDTMESEQLRGNRLPRKLIESVRASSALPAGKQTSYDVENLFDGRGDTAWIEGKPDAGAGEWIEIVFRPGVEIRGIGVLNGYLKSPDAMAANGHVKRLKVSTTPRVDWVDEEQDLKPTAPSAACKDWPASALQWIFDAGESAAPVRKLRLKILDAAAGSKFSDTAISELFIYGGMARKQ